MAGRPSPINATITVEDAEGNPVETTVAERIIEAVRIGSYLEPAAKRAGVGKTTVYGWLEIAGRLRIKAGPNPIDVESLDEHEAACVAFSNALDRAEGMWEIGALGTLERLARGGIQTTKVQTKRGPSPSPGVPGPVLETTTTVETLAPNAQVLEWRLTRRHQERWAQHVIVDGQLDVTISDEERAEDLVKTLDAYLEGVADAGEPAAAAKPPVRRNGRNGRNGNGSNGQS